MSEESGSLTKAMQRDRVQSMMPDALAAWAQARIDEAVKVEREACAVKAEEEASRQERAEGHPSSACRRVAAAIRARKP